jgi:hypothetical protein
MLCSGGLAADTEAAPNGVVTSSANIAAEITRFILASIIDMVGGTRLKMATFLPNDLPRSRGRGRAE